MHLLKKNKVFFFLIFGLFFSFVFLFKSFEYTLCSDEANYLADSLNLSKRISTNGLSSWAEQILSFDKFTSTRFAVFGTIWMFLLENNYELSHLVANGVYVFLGIISLIMLLRRDSDTVSDTSFKVIYIATIPLVTFSTLWYQKDIAFISMALFTFTLLERKFYARGVKELVVLVITLYITILIRPLYSVVYILLPWLYFNRKEFGYRKIVFCVILFTPLIGITFPSLLRFAYATVLTPVAMETIGVLSLKTLDEKVINCFLSLNFIISAVLFSTKSFKTLFCEFKFPALYYLFFTLVIFSIVPHYDIRLLIPSYLVFHLFLLRKLKISKYILIVGIMLNIMTSYYLKNEFWITKKKLGSEKLYKNLSLEIGAQGIISSQIDVIGGMTFIGNISKVKFYSEYFGLDNSYLVIANRLNLSERIDVEKYMAKLRSKYLLIGPFYLDEDIPMNNVYQSFQDKELKHKGSQLTLRSGEKFILLEKD